MTTAVYHQRGLHASTHHAPDAADLVELLDSKWFGDASSSSSRRISRGGRRDAKSYLSLVGSGPSDLSSSGSKAEMEARDWAPLLADVPERVRDRTVSRSANTSVMGPDLSTLHHPHGGVAAGPRQTSPPEAVDTEMRREPSPFEADSDSPGGRLGTWAGRQRVFAEFLRGEEAEEAGRAAARAAAAAADGSDDEEEGEGGERVSPRTSASPPEVQGVRPRHIFGPALLGGEERAASSGPVVLGAMRAPASNAGGRGADSAAAAQRSAEDEDVNMAWRWRFTRKWQMEQAKQFDPAYGQDGEDEDDWGAALGYMAVHGGGLDLATPASVGEAHGGGLAGPSGDVGAGAGIEASPSFSQPMLLDAGGSANLGDASLAREADAAPATRRLAAVASKARHLAARQAEIEHAVTARWESASAGQAWVGAQVDGVALDHWGRFAFVLARLSDAAEHRKLVVRGRNGVGEAGLAAALAHEAAGAAARHRLAPARVAVLASGTAEWSAARDRVLVVRATALGAAKDPLVRCAADADRIVAALVAAALPAGYSVLPAPAAAGGVA
ncbi:hypothetical protein ACKKBF_B01160 [Auxenochlorella protothecoides x Auxenochlorella symbiontica]|uniref:Uncharacterized protein n=1 Tax=Auxenochlorella protothecoides TaxID=3075 RepID=A0A1D1ZUW8_AUXPR